MHNFQSQRRTWVEIDGQALRHNLNALRRFLAPGVKIMAVVKSNAYGHGLAEVAEILSGHHSPIWFGVDSLEEAMTLRRLGVHSPVLILGYTMRDALAEVPHIGARQVVYSHATAALLAEAAEKQGKEAILHLKIETGTARQGIYPEHLASFTAHLRKEHPHLRVEGVYTHFANIEDENPYEGEIFADKQPYWRVQLERFHEALDHLERAGFTGLLRHTAASAAAILYPETHFDMVRFGISLYGLWPSQEVKSKLASFEPEGLLLRPALSWKTKVAQIKRVKRGSPIGYGLTELVTRDSKIAVLPIGYWDGYDRELSSKGEVLIGGKRAKVLGRVCMNMLMVDVTDVPEPGQEDEVVLIGVQGMQEVSAEELAQKTDTINYEIITRINPLIPRVVV